MKACALPRRMVKMFRALVSPCFYGVSQRHAFRLPRGLFYEKGLCTKGAECNYSHEKEEKGKGGRAKDRCSKPCQVIGR